VVFGRSVTYVLKLMRRIDRLAFDDWYSFFKEEMSADPLMRYFNTLRNSVLKEGELQTTSTTHINHLNTDDLLPFLSNPPPGASNFFIGDQVGGSGWEIELPDGQSVKYYVQLPSAIRMTTTFHFPDAPTEHLGQPITDNSVPAGGGVGDGVGDGGGSSPHSPANDTLSRKVPRSRTLPVRKSLQTMRTAG
jgi:hypothetical protein